MEGQTESLVQSSSAIWSSLTALLKVVNNSLWSSFPSPGSMFHPLSHSFSEKKFADESFFHLLIGSRISVTRGWRSHSHFVLPLSYGERMAAHSSILVWRIPRTEEPGGPQSVGSQRVRHSWATKYITVLFTKLEMFVLIELLQGF